MTNIDIKEVSLEDLKREKREKESWAEMIADYLKKNLKQSQWPKGLTISKDSKHETPWEFYESEDGLSCSIKAKNSEGTETVLEACFGEETIEVDYETSVPYTDFFNGKIDDYLLEQGYKSVPSVYAKMLCDCATAYEKQEEIDENIVSEDRATINAKIAVLRKEIVSLDKKIEYLKSIIEKEMRNKKWESKEAYIDYLQARCYGFTTDRSANNNYGKLNDFYLRFPKNLTGFRFFKDGSGPALMGQNQNYNHTPYPIYFAEYKAKSVSAAIKESFCDNGSSLYEYLDKMYNVSDTLDKFERAYKNCWDMDKTRLEESRIEKSKMITTWSRD